DVPRAPLAALRTAATPQAAPGYTGRMDAGAPLSFDAVPVPTPPGGPLAVELVPAPDPWAVARRLAHLRNLLFLDSAEQHEERGRYSYVAADPISLTMTWEDQSEKLLTTLKERLAECRRQPLGPLPPFQGGFAGAFGYELGRAFERIPLPPHNEFRAPDIAIACYDW